MIFEQGKIYYYNGSEWGEIGSSATDVDVFTLTTNTSTYATDASGSGLLDITVPELTKEQLLSAVIACKAGKIIRVAWYTDNTTIEYFNCQMMMSNDTESSNNEYHLLLGNGSFLASSVGLNHVDYDTFDNASSVTVRYYPPVTAQMLNNVGIVDASTIAY